MRGAVIAMVIVTMFLVSGCVSEQSAAKTGDGEPKTINRPAPGKSLFGPADSFKISLKQYANQVESLAKENFADACLILVTGEYPDSNGVGKASLWHYKYYSGVQQKAIVVDVDVRETASKLYAYGGAKSVKVFRDEPHKPCITLSSVVDSTEAGKSVTESVAGISLEYDTNTEGSPNLIYVFTTATNETRISGITGKILV